MDEEQYNELTKDDVNGRPEHCTGLTVVRTNQLVWDLIAPSTQQIDKKLQYIEKSVITAAIIMTRTVNDMAKDESCGNSQVRVITGFTVFRLLTDFVCLYTYEF